MSDKHSSNVEILLNENVGKKQRFFVAAGRETKTFLFFDSAHLIENITINLLCSEKFVFPRFEFNVCRKFVNSGPGYICWYDLQSVHNKDKLLQANLRRDPKLLHNALHPNKNKQNGELPMAIFHDTTNAACSSCLPERPEVSSFLPLIS